MIHPFKIIAFDWDGTAVVNRQEDATPVRDRIDKLLMIGVYVVVITGTNFPNVDRQLTASVIGPQKRYLFVCTNRGSEVYGFDDTSRSVLLWSRTATPRENRLLSAIAESVCHFVASHTGLEVRVIANRLNRRKIDLIPVLEWSNPPKSAIGALLAAVEERLRRGGIEGGLQTVFLRTQDSARELGLPGARITSDVKHVEVGLTDKGDSISWMMHHIAAEHDIPAEDVLIAGDEFGPIAGFEGSDERMMIPTAYGAVFVSVGAEPNGVPPGVLQLGGGPACFRAILDRQIALHERRQSWIILDDSGQPAREHEFESLMTVANGYLGTRGTVHEHSPLARPATLVAGVFNRAPDSIPELTKAPDWAKYRVTVEGEELRPDRGTTLESWRRLDLQRGVFEHDWRVRDSSGRITHLHFVRFVSLADRHALIETLTLAPENYSGRVSVDNVIDGTEANAPVRGQLWPIGKTRENPSALSSPESARSADETGLLLTVHPDGTQTTLAFASSSTPRIAATVRLSHAVQRDPRSVWERWTWNATVDTIYRVEKRTAVYSSRDGSCPERLAIEHLPRLAQRGADVLLGEHVKAWAHHWKTAGVDVGSGLEDQRALRCAVYHLVAAANPGDERTSVGARALTGESYKGHVFWDTEVFMGPFFTFCYPEAARALLMFRYHTLDGARAKARAIGRQGALYPWETTDSGEETTPHAVIGPEGELIRILTGEQEHHISADVAYAAWQYWQATGDDEFMRTAGVEMIVETARFWASRVDREADGRYHIHRVIAPDEYHEGVDDDAYTNGMAQWNLERAVEAAQLVTERWPELAARFDTQPDEIEEWRDRAHHMYTGLDPATGLIEQFRGYFALDDFDLSVYEPRTAPLDVVLGRERTATTQVIKQADVLLLIYLLWDRFPPAVRDANFRYYAPRCGHGSSLDPAIHALLAARLGDLALARRYFRQAAEIDLANNMGNAAGGVHVGALGGLWQATVLGVAGMQLRNDGLSFDPHLLPDWKSLRFPLQWRGRRLEINLSAEPTAIDVTLKQGEPMAVTLRGDGRRVMLQERKRYRAELAGRQWGRWEERSL